MKYFGLTIIVLLFAGLLGGFVYWNQHLSPDASSSEDISPTSPPPILISASTTKANNLPRATRPPTPPAGYKEYRNAQFGFSLYYPENLPPSESLDHGPSITVSFQAKAGQEGFQVYVAPINGNTISSERFKLDEPSGVMKNSLQIAIDGAPGVAFEGSDAQLGATSEVWFIKGHYLYEVSTYKELDSWLAAIMQTWKFI